MKKNYNNKKKKKKKKDQDMFFLDLKIFHLNNCTLS